MQDELNPLDGVRVLQTIIRHRDLVRKRLQIIIHALERRGLDHDLSKLLADEFDGFSRINRNAREHPFDSDEYREGMKRESRVIQCHYDRNRHHPEHFMKPRVSMTWLDIVEMVCDWRAAYETYGSQGDWYKNLLRLRVGYNDVFSPEQWWLIEQVAKTITQEASG